VRWRGFTNGRCPHRIMVTGLTGETDFMSGPPRRHARSTYCVDDLGARQIGALVTRQNRRGLMRPRTAIASLLVTAALIGGGAYAFSSAQSNTQAAPATTGPPPVPVVAEPVKSGTVPIYLRGIGTVQ